MKKRFFTLFFSVAVVFGLLSVTAVAASTTIAVDSTSRYFFTLDIYPYGQNMSDTEVTLQVDTGSSWQWQTATTESGTYTDIPDANGQSLTFTPTDGNWYRCVINDTPTKAVWLFKASTDPLSNTSIPFVKVYKSGQWYISNGTMAYSVWEIPFDFGGGQYDAFDIVGVYKADDAETYWLNSSFNEHWQVGSTASTDPGALGFDLYNSDSDHYNNDALDSLILTFDPKDKQVVPVYAKLQDGFRSMAFGTDTELGTSDIITYSDTCSLKAEFDSTGNLKQIQMVGAASVEEAKTSDPAFVFRPITPLTQYWIGHYLDREAYAFNEKQESDDIYTVTGGQVTEVKGEDSGLTASWVNMPDGSIIQFEISIGSVTNTGATAGPTNSIYTVTFDTQIIGVSVASKTVTEGDPVSKPSDPISPDHTFVAWYTEPECITPWDFDSAITGDITLYAMWMPNPSTESIYTVTFDTQIIGVSVASETVTEGDSVRKPADPLAPGYTFVGWYTEPECTTLWDFDSAVMADITLYAKWLLNVPDTSWCPPTYRVTVLPTRNGKVVSNVTWAYASERITLTVTPVVGNELSTLVITDSKGNVISVTKLGDGRFTFRMPADNVTATSDFTCTGSVYCPSAHFTDLDLTQWYHEGIDYVVSHGLMNGTGNGTTFSPYMATSRAMIWTILARIDGVDTNGGLTWYQKGMEWAMVCGISDGTAPDTPITREQLAAMLWRYAKYKGYDVSLGENTNILSYPDVFDASEYAIHALQWAVGEGIITNKDGLLAPGGDASRAEVSTMLKRFTEGLAK